MLWRCGNTDSTYKTNKYNLPFLLLVGKKHHHQKIIYGSALLNVETEEAYTWLLQTFHKGMNNKLLILVVTDGDKAMHNAIKTVSQMRIIDFVHGIWHAMPPHISRIIQSFVRLVNTCMTSKHVNLKRIGIL
jgi:hypothetical protein